MEQQDSLFTLSIDPTVKAHMNETAKWTRFLAIAGFVFLGIALLASIFGITLMTSSNTMRVPESSEGETVQTAYRIGTVIGMVLMLLVAFFPLYFLLQFSNQLRAALRSNDQHELTLSFQNLKRYFRYLGIMMIILLGIYALAFLLGLMFQAGR